MSSAVSSAVYALIMDASQAPVVPGPPPPPPDPPPPKKAIWTFADEDILLQHLFELKSTADGGINFKMTVFNSALPKINKKLERGAPKSAKSCKQKWTKVRHFITPSTLLLTPLLAQSNLPCHPGHPEAVRLPLVQRDRCQHRRRFRFCVGCVCQEGWDRCKTVPQRRMGPSEPDGAADASDGQGQQRL